MYFNSLNNVDFNGILSDENDLHDLQIIEELSKKDFMNNFFFVSLMSFLGIVTLYILN